MSSSDESSESSKDQSASLQKDSPKKEENERNSSSKSEGEDPKTDSESKEESPEPVQSDHTTSETKELTSENTKKDSQTKESVPEDPTQDVQMKQINESNQVRERVESSSPMVEQAFAKEGRNPEAWSESPAGLTKRQIGLVMVGLMLGLFLASLDQTIVSTALPKIVSDFGRLDLYSWVIIAYLLTSTTTIPIAGKLSDIFGRKICFLTAIFIFEGGSIVCGAAPDMITLIIFRAVQGIGGGAIISLSQIIIGDIVSIRQRGKFGGLFGIVWAGSSVLGPILGGVITDRISWRWIFYINIPIGILSVIFVIFVLKIPGDKVKLRRGLFAKIDYLGALIFVAGIVVLLLGINFGGNQYDWNSAAVILCFILGGLTLIGFVFFELKFPRDPLIPMRLQLNRNVGVTNLVSFGFGWAMFGSISYLPEYFQVVHGDTPTTSGLKLIALMIGMVGASVGSGILITKTGYYYPWPIGGGVLLLIGLGLIGGLLSPGINLYLLSFFIFITGLGIGSVLQTLVVIVQFAVEKKEMAVATAAVSFMRTMGGVVGVAVCGAVLQNHLVSNLPAYVVNIIHGGYDAITTTPGINADAVLQTYSDALNLVFFSCMPVIGIATILAILIKNQKIKQGGGQAPIISE